MMNLNFGLALTCRRAGGEEELRVFKSVYNELILNLKRSEANVTVTVC